MANKLFWTCCILLFFSSCSTLQQSPKYQFSNGDYRATIFDNKKVYIDINEDDILVYPLQKKDRSFKVDTTVHKVLLFPKEQSHSLINPSMFWQHSFDIDFLTMPFKYRFSINGFPNQFNTQLNGAVYLGYRSDAYLLSYKSNSLKNYERQIAHFGFSFGAFAGFGSTAMNPWVTLDQIPIEYDGVIWSKGITSIIGLNNFSVGLALGWDHLLDKNKNYWIYQGKPWMGLAFGLNLN